MGRKRKAVTFVAFMETKVGKRWVVARNVAGNRRRYPNSVFLTKRRFAQLMKLYEKETGCPVLTTGGEK